MNTCRALLQHCFNIVKFSHFWGVLSFAYFRFFFRPNVLLFCRHQIIGLRHENPKR